MQELAKKFEEEGSIILPSEDLAGIANLIKDETVEIRKTNSSNSGDDVVDAEFSETK